MTDAPRSPLRIVLAEDSVLLREGLVRLFDEAGFETVAAYGEADSLIAEIDRTRPDLAVLDVRMGTDYTLRAVYRSLDYAEDAYDSYDAKILELAFGVSW